MSAHACLKTGSSLCEVFPSRMVTIRSINDVPAILGDKNPFEERVYLIVMRAVTSEEREKLAELIAREREVPLAEVTAWLKQQTFFPLRKEHVAGVGQSLAHFI